MPGSLASGAMFATYLVVLGTWLALQTPSTEGGASTHPSTISNVAISARHPSRWFSSALPPRSSVTSARRRSSSARSPGSSVFPPAADHDVSSIADTPVLLCSCLSFGCACGRPHHLEGVTGGPAQPCSSTSAWLTWMSCPYSSPLPVWARCYRPQTGTVETPQGGAVCHGCDNMLQRRSPTLDIDHGAVLMSAGTYVQVPVTVPGCDRWPAEFCARPKTPSGLALVIYGLNNGGAGRRVDDADHVRDAPGHRSFSHRCRRSP